MKNKMVVGAAATLGAATVGGSEVTAAETMNLQGPEKLLEMQAQQQQSVTAHQAQAQLGQAQRALDVARGKVNELKGAQARLLKNLAEKADAYESEVEQYVEVFEQHEQLTVQLKQAQHEVDQASGIAQGLKEEAAVSHDVLLAAQADAERQRQAEAEAWQLVRATKLDLAQQDAAIGKQEADLATISTKLEQAAGQLAEAQAAVVTCQDQLDDVMITTEGQVQAAEAAYTEQLAQLSADLENDLAEAEAQVDQVMQPMLARVHDAKQVVARTRAKLEEQQQSLQDLKATHATTAKELAQAQAQVEVALADQKQVEEAVYLAQTTFKNTNPEILDDQRAQPSADDGTFRQFETSLISDVKQLPDRLMRPENVHETEAEGQYTGWYGYVGKTDRSAKLGETVTVGQQKELADYALTLINDFRRQNRLEPLHMTEDSILAARQEMYERSRWVAENPAAWGDHFVSETYFKETYDYAGKPAQNLGFAGSYQKQTKPKTMLEAKVAILNMLTCMAWQDGDAINAWGHRETMLLNSPGHDISFAGYLDERGVMLMNFYLTPASGKAFGPNFNQSPVEHAFVSQGRQYIANPAYLSAQADVERALNQLREAKHVTEQKQQGLDRLQVAHQRGTDAITHQQNVIAQFMQSAQQAVTTLEKQTQKLEQAESEQAKIMQAQVRLMNKKRDRVTDRADQMLAQVRDTTTAAVNAQELALAQAENVLRGTNERHAHLAEPVQALEEKLLILKDPQLLDQLLATQQQQATAAEQAYLAAREHVVQVEKEHLLVMADFQKAQLEQRQLRDALTPIEQAHIRQQALVDEYAAKLDAVQSDLDDATAARNALPAKIKEAQAEVRAAHDQLKQAQMAVRVANADNRMSQTTREESLLDTKELTEQEVDAVVKTMFEEQARQNEAEEELVLVGEDATMPAPESRFKQAVRNFFGL